MSAQGQRSKGLSPRSVAILRAARRGLISSSSIDGYGTQLSGLGNRGYLRRVRPDPEYGIAWLYAITEKGLEKLEEIDA